jgi:hypothetical protein
MKKERIKSYKIITLDFTSKHLLILIRKHNKIILWPKFDIIFNIMYNFTLQHILPY